ncbi:FecR family protein [Mucilaginibacter sp. KACC 22063]|uniref:FecR family protein n=1 Tax=Mucilaginibacter sp. KACC 22063 TaxID=3025666 RepID=UPI002365A716|nr:FecR family protein [Mucilaginibacter sp. KACC 22063]WDF57273.1 FecR family protein [Mucilaginibacter sp. KACC 22063]
MKRRAIALFLQKFRDSNFTPEEHAEFVKWLESIPSDQLADVLDELAAYTIDVDETDEENDVLMNRLKRGIEQRLDESGTSSRKHPIVSLLFKAAAVLTLIGIGVLFYQRREQAPTKQQLAVKPIRIEPGRNQAYLTLDNGQKIALEHVPDGVLAEDGGITIVKVKDGEVRFRQTIKKIGYARQVKVTVPKGGQYKIVLADGSAVWLNAATELETPVQFPFHERIVKLHGEGYFEVAKDKSRPFKVVSEKMTVQVFGTHFNVSAYADEPIAKATLLEGSVKVSQGMQSKMLKPGQQACVGRHIKLLKVVADEAIEWKNGNFNFNHEDIRSIMRRISRWYNVEIDYRRTITDEGFLGTIPRSAQIEDVLHLLELTRTVHFKIEGRRIIVMK